MFNGNCVGDVFVGEYDIIRTRYLPFCDMKIVLRFPVSGNEELRARY